MTRLLLIVVYLFITHFSHAQVLIDPTEIEERVHQEITGEFLQSKPLIALINKYPDAKGSVSLFITVAGKGLVQTVFKSEGDLANVAFSNKLQDLLKDYRFHFALKKGLACKVQHDFTF